MPINDYFLKQLHLEKEVIPFNTIGKSLCVLEPLVFKDIFLDEFELNDTEYAFIVVVFKNDTKSVRNVRMNSFHENIRELGKLLDGGYYSEVEWYEKLKELQQNKK